MMTLGEWYQFFFGGAAIILLTLLLIQLRRMRLASEGFGVEKHYKRRTADILLKDIRSVPATILRGWLLTKQNYATVRIFYVTDRRPAGKPEPSEFYGTERSSDGSLSLGICEVSIPRDHNMAKLEKPSLLKLEFRKDPEKHLVLLRVVRQAQEDFYLELSARVGRSKRREAFVFIHGFSVSFEDAARRTAQLSYDLTFDGAPILYSWPSEGQPLRYTVDETNVEWTLPHLRSFLEEIARKLDADAIHLIAHSMGNRALATALQQLAPRRPLFRQIVLVAPDIDAGVFRQLAVAIGQSGERVTLYVSSNDQALQLSKTFHGYPRAGDSGEGIIVVPGVDTIDVSAVDTSLWGHSYYAERRSVLSDLFSVMREGKPPSERFGLEPIEVTEGSCYLFKQ